MFFEAVVIFVGHRILFLLECLHVNWPGDKVSIFRDGLQFDHRSFLSEFILHLSVEHIAVNWLLESLL